MIDRSGAIPPFWPYAISDDERRTFLVTAFSVFVPRNLMKIQRLRDFHELAQCLLNQLTMRRVQASHNLIITAHEVPASKELASPTHPQIHEGVSLMTHTTLPRTLTLVALGLSLTTLAFTPAMTEVEGRAIPQIEWKTTLKKFGMDKNKFLGQRFSAMCPKTSQKAGENKTGVYASTHSICQAALNAGAIDKKGGLVTVQVNPGNEIHTGNPRLTMARTMSVVGHANAEATDKVYRDNVQRIKWNSKFTKSIGGYKHFIGQQFTFDCPAAPTSLPPRRIVGTDLYAFNTMTCLAALHAGVLTTDGGLVTVQMNPGNAKLVGSVRNGLESFDGRSGMSALSFVANPVNPE